MRIDRPDMVGIEHGARAVRKLDEVRFRPLIICNESNLRFAPNAMHIAAYRWRENLDLLAFVELGGNLEISCHYLIPTQILTNHISVSSLAAEHQA